MKSILLDDNNDLQFQNGSLSLGNGKEQETRLILTAVPGNWKESPLMGVDLYNEINSEISIGALKSRIRKQLKADGKTVNNIRFDGSKLILE